MELADIIRQRIYQEGPIPFHDYMEMALYEPGRGYYTSAKNKIGPKGDYYTSSTLSPVFGAMIGRQLEEMWQLSGEEDFTIVEYGAGTGALCHSILDYLKDNRGFYEQLRYCIIEKSPVMREIEKQCLCDKVDWYNSIADLGKFTGCILSNELLDNFAVHLVVMENDLQEVFVADDNGFIELLRPASDQLKDYLRQLNVSLPKGFRTEINLQALDWLKEISAALEKGFVLTIDYGFPSTELYREYRRLGTLMCYHQHQVNDNPYHDVGGQDITAHVNFSALNHWGLQQGLECCGFTEQGYFLRSLGLIDYLRVIEQTRNDLANKQQIPMILYNLLSDIGSKLKVLVQRKGLPQKELSGMKVARLTV